MVSTTDIDHVLFGRQIEKIDAKSPRIWALVNSSHLSAYDTKYLVGLGIYYYYNNEELLK